MANWETFTCMNYLWSKHFIKHQSIEAIESTQGNLLKFKLIFDLTRTQLGKQLWGLNNCLLAFKDICILEYISSRAKILWLTINLENYTSPAWLSIFDFMFHKGLSISLRIIFKPSLVPWSIWSSISTSLIPHPGWRRHRLFNSRIATWIWRCSRPLTFDPGRRR